MGTVYGPMCNCGTPWYAHLHGVGSGTNWTVPVDPLPAPSPAPLDAERVGHQQRAAEVLALIHNVRGWDEAEDELAAALEQAAADAEQRVVERMEALADDFDANGNGCPLGDPAAAAWHKAANCLRAALDRGHHHTAGRAMNARTGWLAATSYPVGSLDDYTWAYTWDGQLHPTRQAAIKAGLRGFGSDDFNVGHVKNGVLDWWGWMDEEHAEDLASAAAGLYLDARADAIEAGTT